MTLGAAQQLERCARISGERFVGNSMMYGGCTKMYNLREEGLSACASMKATRNTTTEQLFGTHFTRLSMRVLGLETAHCLPPD